MNCTHCLKMNLPGGLRCVYCGTALPPVPEFDLGPEATALPSEAAMPAEGKPNKAAPSTWAGRIFGPLAVLAVKGKALLGLLKFGKILTTLSSMLVFIWADALLFGWKFGVGIAVCIFVHEMGHVIVNWSKGLKQSAPMFIPFVGAVIFIKQFPNDPAIESESGAGGPVAGALAAVVCLGIGRVTHDPFWLALANLGFLINLFNLIPFGQLDGAHISAVFSPRTWDMALIGMLLWALKAPSALLWFILIVGFLFRLGRIDTGRHLLASPATRIRMAALYLALCVGLSYGTTITPRAHLLQRPVRSRTALSATALQDRAAARAFAASMASNRSFLPRNSSRRTTDLRNILLWTMRVVLLTLAALLWLTTSALLTYASGRPFGLRLLALAGWMCGVAVALYLLFHFIDFLAQSRLTLLGAYFAGTAAALCFAGYHAARNRKRRTPLPTLTRRALAWAAGGALVVAYAANDFSIAGAALGCALAYFVCFPWVAASQIGEVYKQLGDLERALAWRHRAVKLRPDPESAMRLWSEIVALNHNLSRGGPMLEALQTREALAASRRAPGADMPPPSIQTLSNRAGALALLDRFEEAIACCEAMLQASPADALSAQRLMLVHLRLIEIARYRGWTDEMAAQIDWALRSRPRPAQTTLARLHILRAAALAAQERVEEARAECDRALKISREPLLEIWAALARAQIGLAAADPAGAERETAQALRREPGSLNVRYWRARALVACGRANEGQTLLHSLATDYPLEHWGRQAQSLLTRPQ